MAEREKMADGAHENSVWARVMREGTPAERRELRRRMTENARDVRAMDEWGRGGFIGGTESDGRVEIDDIDAATQDMLDGDEPTTDAY